jgi:hypothetical protein
MRRPVLLLIVTLLVTAGCGSGDAMALRPGTPLAADADRLVRQLMEIDFRDRTAAGDGPVVCSVRAFGAAPAGADTVDELTTVWAKTLCATPGPDGLPSLSQLPVKITLGDKPELFAPRDGASFADDVDALFPDLGVDVAGEWPEFPEMRAEIESGRS